MSLPVAFKEATVSGLPWRSRGYHSMLLLMEVQVQSLVWKLRSHIPRGVAKNLKKKRTVPKAYLHIAERENQRLKAP